MEHIERYLRDLSLQDLIFETNQIIISLTPGEKIHYDINRFVASYDDIDGRIQLIKTLIRDNIIYPLQIPYNYQTNPRLVELMKPPVYDYYIPIARELKKEMETCLTDELAEMMVPKAKVAVTNPRWEHTDEEKKNKTPDVTHVGDKIFLFVDVSGIPEGWRITFDIFDASCTPPQRIDTVAGKNDGGSAKVEWTVEDPLGSGEELKLEFEGIAKSKASERCPVAVEIPQEYEITLYIDPEDPATYDDTVILKGIDSDYEQIKTIADDKVAGDSKLTVGFTGCKKGDRYTLVHDDGQGQHVVIEETVYGG
jgi:hypothetical protein